MYAFMADMRADLDDGKRELDELIVSPPPSDCIFKLTSLTVPRLNLQKIRTVEFMKRIEKILKEKQNGN